MPSQDGRMHNGGGAWRPLCTVRPGILRLCAVQRKWSWHLCCLVWRRQVPAEEAGCVRGGELWVIRLAGEGSWKRSGQQGRAVFLQIQIIVFSEFTYCVCLAFMFGSCPLVAIWLISIPFYLRLLKVVLKQFHEAHLENCFHFLKLKKINKSRHTGDFTKR